MDLWRDMKPPDDVQLLKDLASGTSTIFISRFSGRDGWAEAKQKVVRGVAWAAVQPDQSYRSSF